MKTLLRDEELLLVRESLRRELALTETKAKLLREELEQFEKRYELSSADLLLSLIVASSVMRKISLNGGVWCRG